MSTERWWYWAESMSEWQRVSALGESLMIARLERQLLQHLLHHGVQAPRADVLRVLVGGRRRVGQLVHPVGREVQFHALRGQQRGVLPRQAVLRLRQDAAEVGFSETKNYVYKVMGNYRAYRTLYKEDLTRQ